MAWRELQPILDAEVANLPEKYRVPFVLCYLEGHTYQRAAKQLGCVPATISRRLARARKLLQRRLTRRGLALPVGVLAAALSQHAAAAAVAAPLVAATTRAALGSAAGAAAADILRTPVVVLTEGSLRAVTLTKGKILTALLVAATLFGLGAAVLAYRISAEGSGAVEQAKSGEAKAPPKDATPSAPLQDSEKMIVAGRVLDAAGKPVAGARVAVMGQRKPPARAGRHGGSAAPLVQGQTDGDGRFRLIAPRTSQARFWNTFTLALAPGHGLGMQPFDADAADPDCTIRMNPEQVVRGRLVDLQGLPAAGVTVGVSRLGGPALKDGNRALWLDRVPAGLAAWPAAATTDRDGRFTLRGVPRDVSHTLRMDGNRFALQALLINPDGGERVFLEHQARMGFATPPVLRIKPAPGKPLDIAYALPPPHILEGVVTYADTGKPVAQARLICFAGRGNDRRKDSRAGRGL